MYGVNKYGDLRYGERSFNSTVDLEDCDIDLMEYYPDNTSGNSISQLMELINEELCVLVHFTVAMGKQSTIDKATFGLNDWEKLLAIDYNPSNSYGDRREIIKAKLRGFGTVTKQMLINTAEAFSGGEVRIIEYPEKFRFVIQFIGIKGIPNNMQSFIEMIESIKPAHLEYEFKYTYTIWNLLNEGTWNDLNTMSWNDLKVYEGE